MLPCACHVKLPGSLDLWYVCSQRGTSGGYGHTSPLSESSGELSGSCVPSALAVRHLGLPGSAEMADSRMAAAAAAAPGRLTIASLGLKHVEKNHRTGTQILPGSISGFYDGHRYQAARQLLERIMRATFVEIVDLRPLKDASRYPDLRGHMGWNGTYYVCLNMHDHNIREIMDRLLALSESWPTVPDLRGARQANVSSLWAVTKVGTEAP